jgi:ferredoxin-like protein FixX
LRNWGKDRKTRSAPTAQTIIAMSIHTRWVPTEETRKFDQELWRNRMLDRAAIAVVPAAMHLKCDAEVNYKAKRCAECVGAYRRTPMAFRTGTLG